MGSNPSNPTPSKSLVNNSTPLLQANHQLPSLPQFNTDNFQALLASG